MEDSYIEENAQTELIVDKIPDEAIIRPQNFGGLKLVGYYVPPESRTLTERKPICIDTYWIVEKVLGNDFRLSAIAKPVRECKMPPYKQSQTDYPFKSWKPGIIYREKIELFPPPANQMANLNLQITISVAIDGKIIGGFKDSETIKMRVPNLRYPYWRTEFDDIIYQSEPGKCWTAEQLAKVTGGEWIVPPPEGWYTQSFPRAHNLNSQRPNLLLIHNMAAYKKALENIDKFDGAMVTSNFDAFPSNFPLLKVRDIECSMREIGFAARKRFKGRVIAVTGSAGKTTTCNMLSSVLGKDHKIKATPGSSNIFDNIPRIFANLNQDDAYAIIEISLNALAKIPGSITYDITPNVAVVTSIVPAHIGSGGSLENLAKYKCKIFCGMSQGDYAVLNRDMPYYEIFEEKAKSLKLNIITFGTHPEAFVRMPVIENGGIFSVMGKSYKLFCPVPLDQLYDALAVIGVSVVIGFSIEKTLEYLKTFEIVEGRGNFLKNTFNKKRLTIINSAFNANIISMKYALQHLRDTEPNKKSRVAILGDIADLGNQSVNLHKELAPIMLNAETDRFLLCGKFMRYPYEMVKDKLNVIYFDSLDKLLKEVETCLQDGDTVLVKSSHDTGLHKVVELLKGIAPPPPPLPTPKLNIPQALFDVRDFLPEGITPEHNGRMPIDKLKKIHCGGYLYVDAARSWLAMVRAAAQDSVFLNLNHPFNAYRKLENQIAVFKERFEPINNQNDLIENAIRVKFGDKIWQLKPNVNYAAIPGTSSHGYGLAVNIQNSGLDYVKTWLDRYAKHFGFAREYDFEYWHFTYVRGRESVSKLVLGIENLLPEPVYNAEQIQQVSGCKWLTPPPDDWTCNGVFYSRPLRAGFLAAVNQGQGIGISEQLIAKIFRQTAGLICTNPEPLLKFNRPILITPNLKDTIEKLSAFCVTEKFQIVRKTND